MKIAVVHYHLDPGGVTRVIECSSRAMTRAGVKHVVLTGSSMAHPDKDLPVCEVAGLGYEDEASPDSLLTSLRAAATAALGGKPDLWHFHNHALGKNRVVTEVVAMLARDGERLLLQLHDLAEDGRPENAAKRLGCSNPYPLAPHVHYVFVNTRDLRRLTHAGLPEEHTHLLANPSSMTGPAPRSQSPSPLLLYPVRGVRRKNLGELLLLSLLIPRGCRIAITRAPNNPQWLPIHDDWRELAHELSLPVEFAVVDRLAPVTGADSSLDAWFGEATHLITTSVAEGFGMVYLEALGLEKPLLGRELPHLAADQKSAGVHCGDFYQKIRIPASWLDMETLDERMRASLQETLKAWQQPCPPILIDKLRQAILSSDDLDFGNLPELIQHEIIRKIAAAPSEYADSVKVEIVDDRQARVIPATGWLAQVLARREPATRDSGLRNFSLDFYQEKLTMIHGALLRAPISEVKTLDARRVLDACLEPASFQFLTSPGIETRPEADFTVMAGFRAVVFDVYGTLRIAPSGGVRPDPDADPILRKILAEFGGRVPDSPSTALHDAVRRHHEASHEAYPEVDLRELWLEIAGLPNDTCAEALVIAIEAAWHPASWMPGAQSTLRRLHDLGIPLGLLSNAQCDLLPSLGKLADVFAEDLTVLSYQHRIAKPAPELFDRMTGQLAQRGITPAETLYIGNDPRHDIAPAAACGFKTAWFTGHPDSSRPGYHHADYILRRWPVAET